MEKIMMTSIAVVLIVTGIVYKVVAHKFQNSDRNTTEGNEPNDN